MRKQVYFILITLLLSVGVQAQIQLPSYQQLCEYDEDCGKLVEYRKRQRVYRSVPESWVQYYAKLRNEIIAVAKLYKIDAVTLALTPMAENTMNVKHGEEKIENFFEEYFDGVAPLKGEFSIGPGQIYARAALKVEAMAAQIERRPVRTKKEIKIQLKTPGGAIRYAAAILRHAQDVYFEYGIDISKRPEILATLYNLGEYTERAKAASRRRGKEVHPNYFGFFVGVHYKKIQSRLNLPSVLD
jgi:hypothetical protein